MTTLDDWQNKAHALAASKGFWNLLGLEGQIKAIALMHSEVSELLDAVRINPDAPCGKGIPLTAEQEECADIFLRLVDYCAARNIDLEHAAQVKHEYNKTRPYKHGKRF